MKMSEIGKEMLKFQAELAETYGYKEVPPMFDIMNKEKYKETIPDEFKDKNNWNKPVYSLSGILIADCINDIVIGSYGAFCEIKKTDMHIENIHVCRYQEYRLQPRYISHEKYLWYSPKDDTPCKIYLQLRTVCYADYKPDYYYISPFEIYFG